MPFSVTHNHSNARASHPKGGVARASGVTKEESLSESAIISESNGAVGASLENRTSTGTVPNTPLTRIQRLIKNDQKSQQRALLKKPSEFIREMSMSLADRLALCGRQSEIPQIIEFVDIGENSWNKETIVPVDQPLFHCLPSKLIFQGYSPFEGYEAIVSFRNRDKVARRLKINDLDSTVYTIAPWKGGPSNGSRIAPGMEVCYVVKFRPEDVVDYACEIVCTTDRERFVIPIQGIGHRGILDFPDSISFEESPVKHAQSKSIYVRNIGRAPARYRIELSGSVYLVEPMQSIVKPQESIQLMVTFNPKKIGSYEETMTVYYETGEKMVVQLSGIAEDVNIRLEHSQITLEDTYLSLASSKTVRLYNNSSIVTRFAWKTFSSEEEDEKFQLSRIAELDKEEEAEQRKLFESFGLIDFGQNGSSGIVSKRFMNRKKEILSDPLLFDNPVFQVEPLQGEIWPNSFVDVTVIFEPRISRHYYHTLFCDVSGKQKRLPLNVNGIGIGPKARFPFDCVDVETVFVHSLHQYEITLENRGGINVVYHILPKPNSLMGSKFSFNPSEGIIGLDQYQPIKVTFEPDLLGDFNEEFICTMDGSEDTLSLSFRGKVIGPTFNFDREIIDFGQVSFGFPVTQNVVLYNTSEINMDFALRIAPAGSSKPPITKKTIESNKGGGRINQMEEYGEEYPSEEDEENVHDSNDHSLTSEFRVEPKSGSISPGSSTMVTIHLHPLQERIYEANIVLDIVHVGSDVFELPLRAESVIPNVTLLHESIDLGDCFLNYTYESELHLVNDTDLPASYEFITREEQDAESYSFRARNFQGVIGAHSTLTLVFEVVYKKLGMIQFPVFIATLGKETKPLELMINAFSVGPSVLLSSDKVDFGKVPVLQSVSGSITLRNNSLIPAMFICELANGTSSVFSLTPINGTLEPQASVELQIRAFLDDHSKFVETLKIGIQNGGISEVTLSAKGSGSTVWFDDSLKRVNFGDIFTNRVARKEYLLMNKGRRPHTLTWMLEEIRGRKKEPAVGGTEKGNTNAGGNGNASGGNSGAGNLVGNANVSGSSPGTLHLENRDIFTVIPSRFVIMPGEQRSIFIEAYSTVAIEKCREMMVCQCTIDKDPSKQIILGTEITATFVRPLVHISQTQLSFHLMQGSKDSVPFLSDYVTLKNVSSLPLRIALSTSPPFEVIMLMPPVGKREIVLLPKESEQVEVRFNPLQHQVEARVSYEMTGKIVVSYLDHPHKDNIELIGRVSYPNLSIECDEIDFESIQVGTEQRRTFSITNSGTLPVEYTWLFEYPASSRGADDDVFDIHPLQGKLMPEESEDMEIFFFSSEQGEFKVNAICHVLGGPSYNISIKGIASVIGFEFDSPVIDFGKLLYLDVAERVLTLTNTNSVPFNFSCLVPSSSTLYHRAMLSPEKGTVAGSSKQKIQIKFCPCVPDLVDSYFVVQVAHFEPCKIRVKGQGMFSFVRFSLPTSNFSEYQKYIEEAKRNLHNQAHANNLGVTNIEIVNTGASFSLGSGNSTTTTSIALGPPLPTESEIEAEAIRLMVKEKVSDLLSKVVPSHKMFMQTRIDASKTNTRLFKPAPGKVADPVSDGFAQGLSIIDYVYDFGTVVRNTVRKKTVKVTNHGPLPITFFVDKNSMIGSNFSIEPEKVRQLPALESVDLQIVYNAKAGSDASKSEIHVPVMIANGSTVTLILKATMVVPDLQVSATNLDFGDVALGRRKFISFQLSNSNAVPCEWSTSLVYYEGGPGSNSNNTGAPRSAIDKKRRRRTDSGTEDFKLMPKEGILQGDERVEVTLCFTPSKVRRFDYELHLKFGNNLKPTVLPVTAVGYKPALKIEPAVLHLPPVLPYSEPCEAKFVIENPCNHPIEFYSVEFDRQYKEEEEMIGKLEFPSSGIIYTSPRVLGEGLPTDLIDLINRRSSSGGSSGVRASSAGGTTPGTTTGHPSGGAAGSSETAATGNQLAASETPAPNAASTLSRRSSFLNSNGPSGSLLANGSNITSGAATSNSNATAGSTIPARASNFVPLNIIVHGPPLSGKTSQAKKIAEAFNLPFIRLDDFIEMLAFDPAKVPDDLKDLSLRLIQALRTPKAGAASSILGAAIGNASVMAGNGPILSATTGNANAVGAASSGNKEANGLSSASESVEMLIRNVGDYEICENPIPEELFSELVNARLSMPDAQGGFIIDGLDSKFVTRPFTVFKELVCKNMAASATNPAASAVPASVPAAVNGAASPTPHWKNNHLIVLDVPRNIMLQRKNLKKEQLIQQEREQLSQLEALSEDEFERMTEEERLEFETKLKNLKRRIRDGGHRRVGPNGKIIGGGGANSQNSHNSHHHHPLASSTSAYNDDDMDEDDINSSSAKDNKGNRDKKKDRGEGGANASPTKKGNAAKGPAKNAVKSNADNRPGSPKTNRRGGEKLAQNDRDGSSRLELNSGGNDNGPGSLDVAGQFEDKILSSFESFVTSKLEILEFLREGSINAGNAATAATTATAGGKGGPFGANNANLDEKGKKKNVSKLPGAALNVPTDDHDTSAAGGLANPAFNGLNAQSGPNSSNPTTLNVQGANGNALPVFGNWGHENTLIECVEIDGCLAENEIQNKIMQALPPVDAYLPQEEVRDSFVGKNILEEAVFSAPLDREFRLNKNFVMHIEPYVPGGNSSAVDGGGGSNLTGSISSPAPRGVSSSSGGPAATERHNLTSPGSGGSNGPSGNNVTLNTPNSAGKKNNASAGKSTSATDSDENATTTATATTAKEGGKKKTAANTQAAANTASASATSGANAAASSNSKSDDNAVTLTSNGMGVKFDLDTDRREFRYRWTLKAKERRYFSLKYFALDVGKYDLTLHFQAVGARDIYELRCIGHSLYSYINFDYKKIFPKWRKQREDASILHKEYVLNSNTFEFGPLSVNRPKEKNLERTPDNRAILKIHNNSPSVVKVYFCFRYDSKGDQFLLDPSSMELAPNTEQDLNIWAYPKVAGKFDDSILVLVKDNPEVYNFKITCFGVRPELEADKKTIVFERLLLQRVDQKELRIRNPTIMSAGWKLVGWDMLGEEFEVNPVEGVIEYGKDTTVAIKFKAIKPVVIKRAIRLEVYDLERIGNPVQSESIVVSAEAYDTSVDTHFPKGSEGGLDFGVLKVFDENKQSFTLKNRGKYETGFKFIFESKEINDFFTISPAFGILVPSDKTFPIQVIFKALKEVHIKDNLSLKCQITEPSTGEVIASIPIKINAKSVFSKFSILPARDLNFQSLVYGSKASRQIVIENMGEFDFKFLITKTSIAGMMGGDLADSHRNGSRTRLNVRPSQMGTMQGNGSFVNPGGLAGVGRVYRATSNSPPPMKPTAPSYNTKRDAPTKQGQGDQVGAGAGSSGVAPFSITPLSGSVSPGSKQMVNVEFHPDVPGLYEELLVIEISDRGPTSAGTGDGHEYRLIGECCMPGINTLDYGSIFEENSVRKRVDSINSQSFVYVEDEKVFYFGAFLVGQVVQTRFKISNPFKVPCEVSISAKPRLKAGGGMGNVGTGANSSSNQSNKGPDSNSEFSFDVEPKKLLLPSHEHRFVVVSFHPVAIQAYQGIFEAIVENVPDGRSKSLQFELKGEGTLPRINVEKPQARSKAGNPLLKFRRALLGQPQVQSIVLRNEGIIPARVKFDWLSLDSADLDFDGISMVHQLIPQESRNFTVRFRAASVRKLDTEVRLRVLDNAFEDSVIQIQAEAYLEDLSLEGLPNDAESELCLEDCFIDEPRQVTFSLRNNANSFVRFVWTPPSSGDFAFSPVAGHIKPFGSKPVTVSFHPKAPTKLSQLNCSCTCQRIRYLTAGNNLGGNANVIGGGGNSLDTEWDDRIKAIRWAAAHEVTDANANGGSMTTRKVIESVPEPPFAVMENSSAFVLNLPISYTADYCEYECDTSSLLFKTTLMFQTRAYSFPVKNTGKVRLYYRFQFFDNGGNPIEAGPELPFTVLQPQGVILPGETCLVTVKFHPEEVGNYHFNLVGFVQNLPKGKSHIHFTVKGSSLRPYCHFELEAKDYLLSERRSLESFATSGAAASAGGGQNLDPATRVIEIESVGIKSRNVKRFYILNPTSFVYDFEWINESATSEVSNNNTLRCLTPKGTINGGKKFEIIFEFMPETVDILESFWKFSIPEHNILIPFLIICRAVEPNIYLDKTSFNFKSVLINCQIKESVRLINQESIPFNFMFQDFVQDANFASPVLHLSPVSGIIPPKSEIPLSLSFTPNSEKVYNYNLVCSVKKKPTPIVMNVRGEGYVIHEKLEAELPNGEIFSLVPTSLSASDSTGNSNNATNNTNGGSNNFGSTNIQTNSNGALLNLLDFGQVYINERQVRRIRLVNNGKFNFDFGWKIGGPRSASISINPELGTVAKDESITCEIQFNPVSTYSLKGAYVACQIINGRNYKVDLDGTCVKPNFSFSEMAYDFGASFLFKPGMRPLEHRFKIINKDQREFSFDATVTESSAFEVQCSSPTALAPGATGTISVFFYPREVKRYDEHVIVDLNGVMKVRLNIQGEGVELKVEIANLDNKNLSFGAVRVGHLVSKNLRILNRSSIPTRFSLGPASTLEALRKKHVSISPVSDIVIRPKGFINLELRFNPSQRVQPFYEEIAFECPGYTRPFFTLNGTCHGTEVRLENDIISFGAVVQRSSAVRRIQLQNTGDIGVKFKWDSSKFWPDFSISPPEGYISSGMEIPLDISFHPKEVNADVRVDAIPCFIEGSSPLYLSLTGMCVPPVVQNDVVKFNVAVRESETKTIPLTNKNSFIWNLKPVVDHDYWRVPDSIDIEPGQTKQLDVTYTPLEMTSAEANQKHEGSIFVPLPDGSGLLFKLVGTAEKPLPAGNITREVACKSNILEILSIKNWLKKAQRFKVTIEQVKPDVSVILKGHSFLDVPANGTKDYKLGFFAYKEGLYNIKVTFKNEVTQEYLFYLVNFKCSMAAVNPTIDLSTISRQPVIKEITINNPLNISASFSVTCPHPDISYPPNFSIPPRSDGVCTIEFLPLQAKDSVAKLTIASNELGIYQYDLKLTATPAGAERSLHFKVGLGGSVTQTFRFISYCKTRTDYICRIDSPDFTVDKTITVSGATGTMGVEVCVDIVYEPSKLGDIRTFLSLTSIQGGDYICPLFGHCIAPKPQGPFIVKPGSFTAIPFKNVGNATSTFNFAIDNPNFTVKPSESIQSKKTVHVNVNCKMVNQKASKTAKLVVTQPGINVSWIYYLKAT